MLHGQFSRPRDSAPILPTPCRAEATRRRVRFPSFSSSLRPLPISAFYFQRFCFSPPPLHFPLSTSSVSAHHGATLDHGRHKCTATGRPAGVPFGTLPSLRSSETPRPALRPPSRLLTNA